MPFNGTEGAVITIDEAAALTAAYRERNPGAVKGIFMGKDLLNQILTQGDGSCMGIRVYYGFDTGTNQPTMVFVGANANEDDMLAIVADRGLPSPPFQGMSDSLNT